MNVTIVAGEATVTDKNHVEVAEKPTNAEPAALHSVPKPLSLPFPAYDTGALLDPS